MEAVLEEAVITTLISLESLDTVWEIESEGATDEFDAIFNRFGAILRLLE